MSENRKADSAENLNPRQQSGGGDGASLSQISESFIDVLDGPLKDIFKGNLPPLPLLPGQVQASLGQPAASGGAAKSSLPARRVSSIIIGNAEPPRGLDPSVHSRNVENNLAAAAESLRSPGSKLPKVLNEPQQRHPTGTGNSSAVSSSGREHALQDGASEIRIHLASQEFLAAAADKLFKLSAEELVAVFTPIVPNIAACRGPWASKHWAGANLLSLESPHSVRSEMTTWKNSQGEALLSREEIDAIVILIAKIIKVNPANVAVAGPWIQYARSQYQGKE